MRKREKEIAKLRLQDPFEKFEPARRRRLAKRRAAYHEKKKAREEAECRVRARGTLPTYGPLFNDSFFHPDQWMKELECMSPYAALLLANMKPRLTGDKTVRVTEEDPEIGCLQLGSGEWDQLGDL